MKNYIGLNIRYLYEENKLTQNEFGELFGLKNGVVGTYVRGKTNPSIETIQKICNHFNISLDDFINKDISKIRKTEYGDYNTDPLIGLMAQEPKGSFQSAGYVNMINELRSRIEDKDRIITMMEAEIKRLRGGKDYNSKTA